MNFIIVAFVIVFAVQIIFWTYLFKINFKIKSINHPYEKGISIIICGHNESQNLEKNLNTFLKQKYKNFELIYVDDRSNDNTKIVISKLQQYYDNLKYVGIDSCPSDWNPKKYALKNGANVAAFEFLVFSDADCWLENESYLENYNQLFQNFDLGIGAGNFENGPYLIDKLQQYENLVNTSTMLGLAQKGINYTSIGRNWGVSKEIYQKHDWHQYKNKMGGDDDLFLNEYQGEIGVLLNAESVTSTKSKKNWKEYFLQKTRHYAIGKSYNLKNQLLISLFNLSFLLFYVFAIYLLIKKIALILVISVILFRCFILFYNFVGVSKVLNYSINWFEIMIFDVIYLMSLWTIGIKSMLFNVKKWK